MTRHTDAVILAGGLGTRLRPLVADRQKTMAPVAGRPFLDFLLESLRGQGVRRVVLCVGYQADQVVHYYQQERDPGLELFFSREQEPLGTGGAVKQAEPLVRSNPFVVLNGDSFCELDYAAFLEFHRRYQARVTIAAAQVRDRADFGTMDIGPDRQVLAFKEKSPAGAAGQASGFVNAGVYCFDRSVFEAMPARKNFSLEKDLFPRYVSEGLFAFETAASFWDIGTPERYREAQRTWEKKRMPPG